MNLREELRRLEASKDPHRRGTDFETFLARLLTQEGLNVTPNPKAAFPRQTDLTAQSGETFFILEAKWCRRRADVGVISQVRDRLTRVPPDVFACIFSMTGFSDGAINDVRSRRDREIILFNGFEVWDVVDGRISLLELLNHKRSELRRNASAYVSESRLADPPRLQLRTGPDVFQVGSDRKEWLQAVTGFHEIVFSNELLDCRGSEMGPVFSLELQLGLREVADLERVLKLAGRKLGLSGQGCFAINQGSMGWYGFGFQTFLSAVETQDARYDELKWERYHHSEELAYVDRLDTGGLICVSSRQATGPHKELHSSRLQVYFPGIPVDMSRIRQLCDLTGNSDASLEAVNRKLFQVLRFPRIKVERIAMIVSDSEGQSWASGVVVRNPFLKSAMLPDAQPDEDPADELKRMLPSCEFLFCQLPQWHKPDDAIKEYELRSAEGCWIEHYYAMNVVCDWKW